MIPLLMESMNFSPVTWRLTGAVALMILGLVGIAWVLRRG